MIASQRTAARLSHHTADLSFPKIKSAYWPSFTSDRVRWVGIALLMETQWQSDPPGMPIEMQRNRFVPEPVRDQAERVPPLPIRGLPGQCRTAGNASRVYARRALRSALRVRKFVSPRRLPLLV